MADTFLKVQLIISEHFKITTENIFLTSTFDDLNIDLIGLFELVDLIEEKFLIKFERSDNNFNDPLYTVYDKINTVQDLVILTQEEIDKSSLISYKTNNTTMYKYREIEFSQRYVDLFTSFTLLCDYYTKNSDINLLDSRLEPLYQLSLSADSDDYLTQLKYLRYEIPMSRFVPDSEIKKFLTLLKETRNNQR